MDKQIECGAEPSDDDVEVEYDAIKHVHKRAALFKICGEKIWIPFSQIVYIDEDVDTVTVTEFIAKQHGWA